MTLRVLDPGLYTLVVDFGRPEARSLGVPVGGAADRTSLAIGNALVGNPPDAAALEVSLTGPTLEATCDLACVVHGAPFELVSNRQRLRTATTFTLQAGEILEIGGTQGRMRAYLCVAGGIQGRIILGSRSSLEPIRKGAELQCLPGKIGRHFARSDWLWQCAWQPGEGDNIPRKYQPFSWAWDYPDGHLLRLLPGSQAAWFPHWMGLVDEENEDTHRVFRIGPASNRMGLRLEGPLIPYPNHEMISEPVCPGTVQVTPDGQCIILGMDGQTIGGYPKIAQVISADLDTLGQVRPGNEVLFQRVSLADAENYYRAKQAAVHDWCLRLRTAAINTLA